MTGFEPATPSSRTTYATGLRYIPIFISAAKIIIFVYSKTNTSKKTIHFNDYSTRGFPNHFFLRR